MIDDFNKLIIVLDKEDVYYCTMKSFFLPRIKFSNVGFETVNPQFFLSLKDTP